MKKEETVESLYDQVHHHNKMDCVKRLAKKFGRRPQTVRVHWLRDLYAVPVELEPKVIAWLKNYLKKQPENEHA